MAYKRISPQPVVEGGTGAQTLTSHGVLLGNTTSAITATAAGTTGQVLTGVTGAAPTFQSPAASSITITGDSGGGLTGSSFTFTGGTTGITFAGAGTTETLGGTLVVSNGGTGAATFTAYSVICAGTTATGVFQNVSGVGMSGQILTSQGAAVLPQWANPIVMTAQVTLTSSQVKNLTAAPIQLIASPGSSSFIRIIASTSKLHYGGTNAFTSPGGANITLAYTTSLTPIQVIVMGSATVIATSNQIFLPTPSNIAAGVATNFENNAVSIFNSNGTDFAGNAAGDNTIVIQAIYEIVTI